MPRLLNNKTDLKEIESILNSTHWLEIFRKNKIVNNINDSSFIIHENADGFITILHLMSQILKERNHLEKAVGFIFSFRNF